MTTELRIGIVGLGNMGTGHAAYLAAGEVPGGVLAAVSDVREERLSWAKAAFGDSVKTYGSAREMFDSGEVDGVLICTPHYSHPEETIAALQAGLHVLVEKPAGVYTKQVMEMNEAAAASGRVFGIMFNQRTNPLYRKMRELIQSGELGDVRRINWIVTDWYRSQSYYDSGGWRATWEGEGGGVLMNQSPHNLDLWQWVTGLMPTRIRAFCGFGKHRDIEVENDVTAYAEYSNGATGVFITSTVDAPGTNRLEITGDRGKLVAEDGKLTFWRLRTPESEFNRTYAGGFGSPETWRIDVPVPGGEPNQHRAVTRNWVDAIAGRAPLESPGEEGIKGLALANAMLLSAWTDGWVELPLDDELYYRELQARIAASTAGKDQAAAGRTLDVKGTH
ncbi:MULTISPECIES: Gfo/Idh/MocA family oxidoreductase [unclassified Paenibacillus]|uniref:Gfo/Idh/MocA family protein n=1 Tax=unclassified Paenibacillus TaxID=185978 RepID=UPI0009552DA7|nr:MULTISPECIES: Gfo/Idh/MocA family oxidoreductase [unclassified Paenibacillus]ASS64959.1 Gfo/Idh/MocA family oxidoreductase [Paenibacillus sp. RUD330]SIQ99979.1 Predicted dehydrogenase [Paenibacillus sp. RU4X]SIR34789.1 Predicted dehydrogenase [Paenibacillus sp. RU4T]